jgi:hypothetical protein
MTERCLSKPNFIFLSSIFLSGSLIFFRVFRVFRGCLSLSFCVTPEQSSADAQAIEVKSEPKAGNFRRRDTAARLGIGG